MEKYVWSQHEEESLSVILMSTKNTKLLSSQQETLNLLGKTSQEGCLLCIQLYELTFLPLKCFTVLNYRLFFLNSSSLS